MVSTSATSPAVLDLTADLPAATPDAIRALRENTGLSLAGITAQLGIGDRGTWWRWERGYRDMRLQTWALALLATGLHPHFNLKPLDRPTVRTQVIDLP